MYVCTIVPVRNGILFYAYSRRGWPHINLFNRTNFKWMNVEKLHTFTKVFVIFDLNLVFV